MAKKSDGNGLLQLVVSSIGIDKGDVSAVLVAQIEAQLNADYKYHRAESKRLVAEAGDAEVLVRKTLVDAFIDANKDDPEGIDAAQAGHDFWLTRNGHGAGFWDRGLGERGDRLTNAAHVYGACDLYLGDDGFVYVQ